MKTRKRFLTATIVGLILLALMAIPIGISRRAVAQEERNVDLMQALRTGQIDETRSLLAQGADPNARDPSATPSRGLLQHIVDLFTHAQPPEVVQERTALSCACTSRNAVVLVKLLLDHGADAKADETGQLPGLFWAARRGDFATSQLLLDHGSNANANGLDGVTPLRAAIRADSPKLVRLLLDHGAVVDTWAIGEEHPPIGHHSEAILQMLNDTGIKK
jgi:hypothetical protein